MGGSDETYRGLRIIEIEVYYSHSGQTLTEYGVFQADGNMNLRGHFGTVSDAKAFADWLNR